MSNCIKDLYDYDLVKKCCRCGIVSLKSNFHNNKLTKDGVRSECMICRRKYYNENQEKTKKYYVENRDQIRNNQKLYKKQNRTKINLYEKKKRETDFVYKLANNIRVRTGQSFKSQNVRKTNKTFDLLGCSHSFFRKWILYQLYGDMTEENYGEIWCLDHCYPLSKTNLSDKKEMNKTTYWINLRPMYCSENISKGGKIDHRLYLLQEVKAFYFMKLNVEEGLDQDIY